MRASRVPAIITAMLILLTLPAALLAAGPPDAIKPPVRYLPVPPSSMTLCGEKVPLKLDFVAEQLEREFNIAVHDQAQVVMWMKRGGRYFPYISAELKKAGLPDDLKYLAVAESALLNRARSYAGAVGAWQFISQTGRRYGLRRDRWFDDRRNVKKATRAAIAYLGDLHAEFGSWPLAMAAYNCGEARVRKELKNQGERDYYHLYLPDETMRYVYRILSVKAVLENPARYGYHLPQSRIYRPIPTRTVRLNLKRPVHLKAVARAAGTTVRRIKELNPEIRRYHLPRGRVSLEVPPEGAKSMAVRLAALDPGPLPRGAAYTVKSGDTLSAIAKKTGSKVADIRRVNRIKGSVIRPGQKLVIP